MYPIDSVPSWITIGNQGESGVNVLDFDCTGWFEEWPSGAISVTFIAPGETEPAPVPSGQISVVDGVLSVRVERNMTLIAGNGSIVVRMLDGLDERKSSVIAVYINPSHMTPTGEMPTIFQDWVADAEIKLDEVEQALADTNTALGVVGGLEDTANGLITQLGAAKTAAETATGAANSAAGSANSAASSANSAAAAASGAAGAANTAAGAANLAAQTANNAEKYVHIRYADVPAPTDGQMSATEGLYIGVCRTANATAPTAASAYTWNRIQGDVHLATFELDVETGKLYFNKWDGYDGPEFAIVNGKLEVTL